MEKIDASDADRVSEAIVIWVGPVPALGYDPRAALAERFGAQEGARLLPILNGLADDFYTSNAARRTADLREMHKFAVEDFKRMHPEISDEAANVLASDYTYQNR
jgi:hypothetical protein